MKLLEKERFNIILNILNEKNYVTYEELEKIIGLSSSTVRRDVNKMEKMQLLTKISGGIEVFKENKDVDYNLRQNKNVQKKKKIAKIASKFLNKDEMIFLDAGSSTYELIPYLKNMNITVVTNSTNHLEKLIENNVNTIIIGGKVKFKTRSIVGSQALLQLKNFNFDACFMGANGVCRENGFSTPDIEEATLKKTVIEKSKKKYILADSTKFNKVFNVTFARFEDCVLITEN